jgi:hypothetical protein
MSYAPSSKQLNNQQHALWLKLMQLKDRSGWPESLATFFKLREGSVHNMESLHDMMAQWCFTLSDADVSKTMAELNQK